VENSKNTTIIIVSTVGGILVIAIGVFAIVKYKKGKSQSQIQNQYQSQSKVTAPIQSKHTTPEVKNDITYSQNNPNNPNYQNIHKNDKTTGQKIETGVTIASDVAKVASTVAELF
jgi:predicted PurR-regulated permease PerM